MKQTANEQLTERAGRRAEKALRAAEANTRPPTTPDPVQVSLLVVTKTADYTLTDDDDVVRGDTSGGDITLTVPLASGRHRPYYINKVSALNTLTVARSGSDTVNGAADVDLLTLRASLILIPVSGGYESF